MNHSLANKLVHDLYVPVGVKVETFPSVGVCKALTHYFVQ